MQLKILTPSTTLLQTQTSHIHVSTQEGELGILDRHEAMVCALAPGVLKYFTGDQWHEIRTTAGILDVKENQVLAIMED